MSALKKEQRTHVLRHRLLPMLGFTIWLFMALVGDATQAQTIGNHTAVYDARGILVPWTSWGDAIDREMDWYLNCPVERGYPRFVFTTFMDGEYELIKALPAFIPAMQNGMGIISYLKYYAYKGKKDPRVLQVARAMGNYLVRESISPDTGRYPRFSRSTGWAARFPQPPDCGSFADRPYEVEPDKGGLAGYALVLLYEQTEDEAYLRQALQNARVLVDNMQEGNETRSPWPFRVDYRTGEARGEVSGNMSFILRLFDRLIEHGYKEFKAPRESLWAWIKEYQIPNAAEDGLLWNQFFEDIDDVPDNRTAWAPLNMARYLIEQEENLDPDWQADAKTLIDFTIRRFTTVSDGIAAVGEQDYHLYPWGGVVSNYGAVLAMYSAATGSGEYKGLAYQALTYVMYAIDEDGCPGDGSFYSGRGGWQEDAHTDVIHNFMDAIAAFPEWAK